MGSQRHLAPRKAVGFRGSHETYGSMRQSECRAKRRPAATAVPSSGKPAVTAGGSSWFWQLSSEVLRSKCVLRRQMPNPATSPAINRASVPGSGTAATAPAETAPPVTGDPLSDGSKMNVPPAATVRTRCPRAGRCWSSRPACRRPRSCRPCRCSVPAEDQRARRRSW